MEMKTIPVPIGEYLKLKEKAELSEELLFKLVRGLEDIRAGRIIPWDSISESID